MVLVTLVTAEVVVTFSALIVAFVVGFVMFVMIFLDDGDSDLHLVGHVLLDVVRHVFLKMHGHWTVYWDVHRHGHFLLHRVRDEFLHRVRCWVRNLDGVRHGFLNVNGDWVVNMNLHGVVYDLLNGVRHFLLYWDGHRLIHMDGHWVVNVHLDRVMDDLLNWVRNVHLDGNLYRVVDFLLNRVGLRYLHFYWVRHVLFNGVGDLLVDLDGYGPINMYVHGVGHFLLHWVRLLDVLGYFDDFLHWVVYSFHDWVRCGNVNLYRVVDSFLNGDRDVFLHWVRHWHFLHRGDGFVDFFVMVFVAVVFAKALVAMTAEVMPAEIGESPFVLFLFLHRFLSLLLSLLLCRG